jgi:hypothetical protein
MKTRFLLKLAQLKLKRKQMEDSEQYFESLIEVKKSHEKMMLESGAKPTPSNMSPDKHVDVALLKARLGDMRREREGDFGEAATFYLQAEEYLLQLTDNSYVDALEQAVIKYVYNTIGCLSTLSRSHGKFDDAEGKTLLVAQSSCRNCELTISPFGCHLMEPVAILPAHHRRPACH